MMKAKKFISLIMVFAVCAAALCLGTTVSAVIQEIPITENFFSEANFVTNKIYIQEEKVRIDSNYKKYIREAFEDTAKTTGFRLGVYISSNKRSNEDIKYIAQKGAEFISETQNTSDTVFLYLDMAEPTEPYSYMYCTGKTVYFYSNGSDGTEDRIGHILDETQSEIRRSRSSNYSQYVHNGLDLYARELTYYYQKGPVVELPEDGYPETSQQENTDDPTAIKYRDDNVYFYDEADIFPPSDRKHIVELLQKTSADIEFNLALYVGGQSRLDSVIEEMAASGAEDLFSFDKYYGTVFLYIDMDGHSNAYDYMFCAKDAFLYYPNGVNESGRYGSEDRIDKILEAMQRYFPKGGSTIYYSKIVQGIETYCNELIYYKNKGLCDNTWYRDYEKGEYVHVFFGKINRGQVKPYTFLVPGIIAALIVGFILSMIILAAVKNRYKFKNPASASLYTSRKMMVMRESDDTFLGAHTTKVRLSSSSGSHGGGGGGGGHHSGGGGGRHR